MDFETISPSLLAFFFRKRTDLLPRLEFLAISGSSPTLRLCSAFKPSDNVFAHSHPHFGPWRKQRALHLRQLRQQARGGDVAAAGAAGAHGFPQPTPRDQSHNCDQPQPPQQPTHELQRRPVARAPEADDSWDPRWSSGRQSTDRSQAWSPPSPRGSGNVSGGGSRGGSLPESARGSDVGWGDGRGAASSGGGSPSGTAADVAVERLRGEVDAGVAAS